MFEVGRVIDLEKQTISSIINPGLTLIRGGIDVKANEVIIQHICIRPGDTGEARASGFAEDSISTLNAHDLFVDHCSFSWAVDENLSAPGSRFTGETPDEWRAGTSRNILCSRNLIAERLADSTHP